MARSKKSAEKATKKIQPEVEENVVSVKKKNSKKKKSSENKISMVQESKEKVIESKDVVSLVKEEEIDSSLQGDIVVNSDSVVEKDLDYPKHQKAYFFPRLLAYALDFVIVTILSTLVLNMVPQDKNYQVYLEEYQKIQAEFMSQEITPDEYVNKSVDVIYDLDYSNVIPMIIEVAVLILYYIVFQFYNKGQTLGKKLLRIRVVSSDYGDATMDQFILRSFVIPAVISKMAIIALVLFLGRETYYYGSFTVQGIQVGLLIISIFMIMYSGSGRGLHDRLAKTTVIMTD